MGIYDRDYYRGDRRAAAIGSLVDLTPACAAWMALCVAVFVAQLVTRGVGDDPGPVTRALQLVPEKVMAGEVWRLVTYAFVHDTHGVWPQLVLNLLFLAWFASEAEVNQGRREFVAFMLASTVFGGVAYVLSAYGGLMGLRPPRPFLGSTAPAVAAMVFVGSLNPWRNVIFFGALELPIWLFLFIEVFKDYISLTWGVRIVWHALGLHAAAGVWAFLYARNQLRLTGRPGGRRPQPARLRVYPDEPASEAAVEAAPPPPPAPVVEADEHLEARLDAVLEKVARHGQNSLSETEKQILFRASEIYKRRRRGDARPDLL